LARASGGKKKEKRGEGRVKKRNLSFHKSKSLADSVFEKGKEEKGKKREKKKKALHAKCSTMGGNPTLV